MPGGTTFGRYVLLERLGTGAMGDVHLARRIDGNGPSPVVVKRLHAKLATQDVIVKRFRHEAELASYVDSPHVAKVYDAGIVDGQLYIAMEYIAGWPLSRLIAELKKQVELPTISATVRMMEGALEGLAALHGAVHPKTGAPLAIVHRDIAPKNIMIGEDGRSRLIDLGIGRSNARDWKTRTGLTVGTPGYMPPEQLFGDSIDHRADIYSAAVVLFELLTLTYYIERGPLGQMLHAARVSQPRAPSSVRGDVPRALDAVVMKALALRPEDRFSSASELAAALREAVPRSDSDDAAALIDELLWQELAARKTKVLALLASDPAFDPTRSFEPTPPAVPPPRRSRFARALPIAVAIGGAAIGIGIADLRRERAAPEITPAIAIEAPPAPTVSPARASEKGGNEIEIDPIPTTEIDRAPKRERRRAKRTIERHTERVDAPQNAETKTKISPASLLARAKDLRARLESDSERGAEAAAILREINLRMASGDGGDYSDLARRLDMLERQSMAPTIQQYDNTNP